jgi:hypothetical protein
MSDIKLTLKVDYPANQGQVTVKSNASVGDVRNAAIKEFKLDEACPCIPWALY